MHVNVQPPTTRGPVMYARLKPVNHVWLHEEAKRNGFKSTSEFADALFDQLRTGDLKTASSVTKTTTESKTTKKKATRARRKSK